MPSFFSSRWDKKEKQKQKDYKDRVYYHLLDLYRLQRRIQKHTEECLISLHINIENESMIEDQIMKMRELEKLVSEL